MESAKDMLDGAGDTSIENNVGSIINGSTNRDLPIDSGDENKVSCLGDCTDAVTKSSQKKQMVEETRY